MDHFDKLMSNRLESHMHRCYHLSYMSPPKSRRLSYLDLITAFVISILHTVSLSRPLSFYLANQPCIYPLVLISSSLGEICFVYFPEPRKRRLSR